MSPSGAIRAPPLGSDSVRLTCVRLRRARVREIAPGVRVLFVSGYTENTIVHHGVLDPGVSFLAKPFSPNALAERVRTELDA